VPERTGVLHLINTGGPGGAEQVLVNIVRSLDPSRWRSVVVVPDRGWIYEELKVAGVNPVVLGHASYSDLPRYVRELGRLIRSEGIGLIHSHLFGPTFIASLLGLLYRIPVVATLHGTVDLDPKERFQSAKFALVNLAATRIVFVSDALRNFFLSTGLFREVDTTVIRNGIAPDERVDGSDTSLRSEFGAPANEFLVGAVGNVRAVKGYDIFLEAASVLTAKDETYRFVIVGQDHGTDADELRALRRQLGLDSTVRFAGFRTDINRCLAAFDLYVLTSRNEGFSLSLVEAMAAGLPVIATRCGGPENIIRDGVTGILIENGSASSLAEMIERLRDEPSERQRLGTAARQSARDQFSLETQVRAYERLYSECLVDFRQSWRKRRVGRRASSKRIQA
jgi:glycosyltransferase involved in cell wall biosynthesis